MASKLSNAEVRERLTAIDGWELRGSEIARTYTFKNFSQSIAFVNQMAEYAERVNHHPDILVTWNKVTLRVFTHDAGGLTDKDFALASEANAQARS